MQSRTPHQRAAGHDPLRVDIEARLSEELAAVVIGARRRALRDGDRQIDTAHLLHTLLESAPEVRAPFDSDSQVARLLGYLVQRSIGYGLRWQSSVEDSGAIPTVTEDGWSPVAVGALEVAYERALRRGDERAGAVDLLAAIVAEPESRAVEVLGRAGVDVAALLARIDAAAGQGIEA
ncbi:Clp protease N-terminal domain-containing protein [Streptomyces sp. NBC_00878]|uniref:Clp protease N-terminal domain-containing protein n=1 Tax=Streptomyces sp. NBC_00878 TaxID=2975854 RepID=UPI00224E308D|nr:Clp protease N-terminal domain-containing protein [Streptomyces sp. NBC_00878]MCX4910425.1 Clp protease N-terminal domain-containing protein [Streptomyces sp. NBC_00878]